MNIVLETEANLAFNVIMFKGYLWGFRTMQTGEAQAEPLTLLHEMRSSVGVIETPGLHDSEILSFLETDPKLSLAIREGFTRFQTLATEYPELYLDSDERNLITSLQEGYVNFYNPATVTRTLPLQHAVRGSSPPTERLSTTTADTGCWGLDTDLKP